MQPQEHRGGARGKKEPPAPTASSCGLGTILRVIHASYHIILTPTCFYFPPWQIRKPMSREAQFPKLANRQLGILLTMFVKFFKWVQKWIE